MVSGWCQHGDEVAASRCQRKKTKFVGYVLPVGNGGKQPVEVVLVDTSWEEGGYSKEVTGVRTQFGEERGREGQFDGRR